MLLPVGLITDGIVPKITDARTLGALILVLRGNSRMSGFFEFETERCMKIWASKHTDLMWAVKNSAKGFPFDASTMIDLYGKPYLSCVLSSAPLASKAFSEAVSANNSEAYAVLIRLGATYNPEVLFLSMQPELSGSWLKFYHHPSILTAHFDRLSESEEPSTNKKRHAFDQLTELCCGQYPLPPSDCSSFRKFAFDYVFDYTLTLDTVFPSLGLDECPWEWRRRMATRALERQNLPVLSYLYTKYGSTVRPDDNAAVPAILSCMTTTPWVTMSSKKMHDGLEFVRAYFRLEQQTGCEMNDDALRRLIIEVHRTPFSHAFAAPLSNKHKGLNELLLFRRERLLLGSRAEGTDAFQKRFEENIRTKMNRNRKDFWKAVFHSLLILTILTIVASCFGILRYI